MKRIVFLLCFGVGLSWGAVEFSEAIQAHKTHIDTIKKEIQVLNQNHKQWKHQ